MVDPMYRLSAIVYDDTAFWLILKPVASKKFPKLKDHLAV